MFKTEFNIKLFENFPSNYTAIEFDMHKMFSFFLELFFLFYLKAVMIQIIADFQVAYQSK